MSSRAKRLRHVNHGPLESWKLPSFQSRQSHRDSFFRFRVVSICPVGLEKIRVCYFCSSQVYWIRPFGWFYDAYQHFGRVTIRFGLVSGWILVKFGCWTEPWSDWVDSWNILVSIAAASKLFAAVIAWISPVKWRLNSSIGITCEYPPPAAPPFIPNVGP